ncbi:hypothetical protein [Mesorhizobium helmanticense]|uniref:Uncharacterized protein n=1 Tax=Mesorhizobium helmanticense TaxID=1776423 RepID=A0A2T4ILT6_9HYPH|nr:hypothetical protein [Mesorhizobium helmanticense]PTE06617.1 hypothetical protein C9427_30835 [Mesorhizobium helmanticense]
MTSAESALDHSPDNRHTLACRKLIAAYAENHEHVDWADIQDALAVALDAFGLPGTFIERAQEGL